MTNGENNPTVTEFWKSFNIELAIGIIAETYTKVSQSCMNRVWKKWLPHFVHDFLGFECGKGMKKLQQYSVALTEKVVSDNMEETDVVKLFKSHKEELLNEELMQLHEELGFDPKDSGSRYVW
jgi:hypothetical protein